MVSVNRLKVISLFNTLNTYNTGLENFMYLGGDVEKTIIVFGQTRRDAESFLGEAFPGIKVDVLSLYRRGFLGFAHAVYYVRKESQLIIHAHHTKAALIGAMLRVLTRCKFVVTVHSNFMAYSFRQKMVYLISYLICDRLVCNSSNTLGSLPGVISKGKTSVIYNGVDFYKINKVTSCVLENKGQLFRIGTACRFVPEKDLQTLVHAFKKFNRREGSPKAQLVMVGDGPEAAPLKKLVNRLGLDDDVNFVGKLNRSQVYAVLHDLDVFVVTSRWEGFCNAMVEAAGAGLPIISTDIQPLPEVIGKENAFFFDVGDTDALSNLLSYITAGSSRAEVSAVSRNAKSYVTEKYSLEISSRQYLFLYQNTLFG